MLSPTETVRKDGRVVEGRVASVSEGRIELALVGTDYRLRLVATGPIDVKPGDKIRGVIRAQARRVDVAPAGGRYVEPVVGRPRRVQGAITAIDDAANAITVAAGPPIVLRLDARQRARDFEVGQLATTDVEPGATFTPEAAPSAVPAPDSRST